MPGINIIQKKEVGDGWKFVVGVDGENYEVDVKRDYWEKLTDGKIAPEELMLKSFEFLLRREPKESILRKFSLPVINRYFPEYEQEIRKLL